MLTTHDEPHIVPERDVTNNCTVNGEDHAIRLGQPPDTRDLALVEQRLWNLVGVSPEATVTVTQHGRVILNNAGVDQLLAYLISGTAGTAQERLAFLGAIVESSDDAIIGQDLDGIITSWNAAACRMYGYTTDEAIGRSILLIVPEDLHDELCTILARVRQGDRMQHFDTVRLSKSGMRLDTSVSTSPIKDAEGRVVGAATIARDMTERKRAEEDKARLQVAEAARVAAEASERRFRLLAEASAVLEVSLESEADMASVTDLVVPTLADWCAIDIIDEHGRACSVTSANDDAVPLALRRELERRSQQDHRFIRGVPRVLDGAVMRGSSYLRHLRDLGLTSLIIAPLRAHGQALGALILATAQSNRHYGSMDLSFAEDMARRCALALENSRLYRAAQQSLIARSEFLAATSHELRTPLGHVKGFVSTLRRTDIEFDEATRADFLAEVEREADRLADLIADLLDWSRIASGGFGEEGRASVLLGSLVAGGLDRVRGALGDRQLLVDIDANLPALWVEASQIERVIANLVDNATKYSPPASSIRITGKLLGSAIVLRVEDEGLGIPSRDLERIFEPFFRETGGGWPAKPGTGLGLAVCRGIVEAHGGQIRAENRAERGAAFVVTLPAEGSLRK